MSEVELTQTSVVAPGFTGLATSPPGSFECVDEAGRRFVLKPVPPDCLVGSGLHPAISDRLTIVRGLAHARLATLVGVVRGVVPETAFVVWSFVGGRALDQVTLDHDQLLAVAQQVINSVGLLHARGIVHGGLTASNVIVDSNGDAWLTHVSPYLWEDPQVDVNATAAMLGEAAGRVSISPSEWSPDGSLADLHTWVNDWSQPQSADPFKGRGGRRRTPWMAAIAGALVCVAFAWSRHQWNRLQGASVGHTPGEGSTVVLHSRHAPAR